MRAGISVREPDWVLSPAAVQARRQVVAEYQCGELEPDAFYAHMAQALRGLYDESEVARIHDAWLIEDYPGVKSLVEEVGALDAVATACLSNTNASHWRRLASTVRPAEFPACAALGHRFSSHLLRAAKPSQKVFRAVEQALEVPAGQILFFDDDPDNVCGARGAGWTAEHVTSRTDTSSELRVLLTRRGVL